MYELVAQQVEQRPFKAWVLGSNPSELTTHLPANLSKPTPHNPQELHAPGHDEASNGSD